jgi:ornithine--oxo-acid transaminase
MENRTTNRSKQAKPTHQNIIRLAPPLVITDEEIESALSIIKEAMEELPHLKGEEAKGVIPPEEHNVHIGVDN